MPILDYTAFVNSRRDVRDLSHHTLRAYAQDLRTFARFVQDSQLQDPISREDILAHQRVRDAQDQPISEFRNSLFIWTTIMSKAKPGHAVCDAGLKVQSVDSGLPVIYEYDYLEYINCSDEHGVIADPRDRLRLKQKLKLVPGHFDPTCNLHDWYVGVRDDRVECLWPVSARGRAF